MKKYFWIWILTLVFTGNAYAHEALKPFPLMMYDVPTTEEAFREVKSWGINYVHRYSMGKDIKGDQAFFDLAQKYNLKVAANLDGRRKLEAKDGLETMRAYVQHFKNHPALGFWYLYDEPDNKKKTPNDISPFYQMLKQESPDVPVALCHAWTENWYKFNNVQDILMNDIYPVTGEDFPNAKLDNTTRFTERALKVSNQVIPVIQFFNWKIFTEPTDKIYRGAPVEKLRYPNDMEMRYYMFSSLAQGVRGLAFFSYRRSDFPQSTWATDTAIPVLSELKAFSKLIEGAQFQNILGLNEGKVLLSSWKNNTETYLVAANASPKVQTLTADVKEQGTLQALGKTRVIGTKLDNKKLVIPEMQPWEIFVWKVIPN